MHSFIVFAENAETGPGLVGGERTLSVSRLGIKTLPIDADPGETMAFRGVLLLHCTDLHGEDEGVHKVEAWLTLDGDDEEIDRGGCPFEIRRGAQGFIQILRVAEEKIVVSPGDYLFHVAVDGRECAPWRLTLLPPDQAEQP